ncbi:MAG: type IV pilus assembly protein PilM [Planctomycetota bacterium]
MFGRNKSLVGLDIGSSSVKAVELTRVGSTIVISGMGSAPIESPDTVRATIQKVLTDSGIKSRHCATSVSGRSVIIRQVPMVQLPDAELLQAIEYAADKYIPFDVNEVQLAVQRVAAEGGDVPPGQIKVLLVAAKKVLIEEHVALLQSVGLEPTIIDVDVFALGNAFELRNLALGINDQEVRALVDIGSSKTNINIMRGNVSYFQREIYVAGNDLTEAVAKRFGEDPSDVERMKRDPGGALESMQDAMLPVLEDMGSEIRLSFDYFENQFNQQVKEVYLSGGTCYFPGVDTLFGQIFNLPTKLWDPTEGLEIAKFNPTGMSGANSDMAIAIGLAGRVLGDAQIDRSSTISPARAAESESAAGVIKPAVIEKIDSREVNKHWTTGIIFGVLMSVAIGVALSAINPFGYTQWWVIGEGLPLGMAVGFGLWQGLKHLRRAPSNAAALFIPLLISLICCGSLIGIRYFKDPDTLISKMKAPLATRLTTGETVTPEELAKKMAAGMAAAGIKNDDSDKEKMQEDLKNLQNWKPTIRPKTMDLNDISRLMYIFSQLVLTIFVAVSIISRKLQKIRQ